MAEVLGGLRIGARGSAACPLFIRTSLFDIVVARVSGDILDRSAGVVGRFFKPARWTKPMADLPENLLYEGVSIDIRFGTARPVFGDLFLICGDTHRKFPPSGAFAFDSLSDLQFEQVDDFFGVRSLNDEGDDVPIWLYPLVDGEPVYHHSGPFDGVRLTYNVLRNPARRADHYLKCVAEFARFGVGTFYRNRDVELGLPPDLAPVRADINAVVQHWSSQRIEVGSNEALEMDF
jgi:hypothetical protein